MEDPDLNETSLQLANERDRYRAVFLNMAEPAFVVDNSFRLIAVNWAFEKFFGAAEDEVKGSKCRDLLNYELCGACPLLHAMKEIKVSVVVDEKYLELGVRALHAAFGLDREGSG